MKNYYLSLICICIVVFSSCHVSTSSKQADTATKDSVQEATVQDTPAQDIPTQLAFKLGELYGDNPPGVVGFSVESKNCPDFIGGIYINDQDTLVIQIRGDSATVRKKLEEALQSTEFIVEPAGAYTQKELNVIQNELSKRWQAQQGTPVMQNLVSSGVGINDIEVRLMVNTPEKRREFREKVMDSPAFRFTGPEEPAENATVGISDMRGVSIRPEYSVYSTQADKVTFILYNNSGGPVYYGAGYSITYEDAKGVWRVLPGDETFISVAYGLENKEQTTFTANLYPNVHKNIPGRYRFFLDVTIGDLSYGLGVNMMAEFRLSDDESELARATKTPVPDEILHGISEEEYLAQQDSMLATKVFEVAEQMPEFPNGGQSGLLAFIQNNISDEVKATNKEERIPVRFIVERDGSITNIEILRSQGDKQLENEAIRIIKKMPKWIPGRQRGKAVRVKYTIPVTFRKE